MMTAAQKGVFEKLQRFAREWGGELRYVSEEEYRAQSDAEALSSAPFASWDLGVAYHTKVILFSDYCMPEELDEFGINLIHEIAHVFASLKEPNESEEFAFFGWEMALSLEVGFTIDEFWEVNRLYSVTGAGAELQGLTPEERTQLYEERISVATHSGLLRNGSPVAIR